jgi:quaternary ammonium compound-resistance protein SugE
VRALDRTHPPAEADEGVPYRQGEDGAQEHDMSWILLIVAGLLEVAWAAALPATDGLTRPVPTAGFLMLLAASMFGLAKATETIPLGTAYGVWVGIGAVGAAIVGIAAHGDPASPARIGFLALLVIAIVGLKATGAGH